MYDSFFRIIIMINHYALRDGCASSGRRLCDMTIVSVSRAGMDRMGPMGRWPGRRVRVETGRARAGLAVGGNKGSGTRAFECMHSTTRMLSSRPRNTSRACKHALITALGDVPPGLSAVGDRAHRREPIDIRTR